MSAVLVNKSRLILFKRSLNPHTCKKTFIIERHKMVFQWYGLIYSQWRLILLFVNYLNINSDSQLTVDFFKTRLMDPLQM